MPSAIVLLFSLVSLWEEKRQRKAAKYLCQNLEKSKGDDVN